MSKSFYGSICLTDLIEQMKVKHSAFSKGKNGKIYANVNVWLNDQQDKFGNIMSVQLNPTKERKDTDAKVYIGNMKESENSPKPVDNKDIESVAADFDAVDDLPF